MLTMKKRYSIILTETEREELHRLIATGTAPARKLTHARVLLKADQGPKGAGWADERIAEAVEVSQPTISRIRKQYVEEGLDAALNRRAPNREYHRKLDGEQEARLVALACGEPPEGQARWSLRLLADKVVELEIADSVSYQTVGRILKKRVQAASEEAVVHTARAECAVRVPDGGYPLGAAGGVLAPIRPLLSPGVHG